MELRALSVWRDPLVRRRTVITLGSPGHSDHPPEPDSTSELGESACGRISITVKNLPLQSPDYKADREDQLSKGDPQWITIRHVDSPAPAPSGDEVNLPNLLRPQSQLATDEKIVTGTPSDKRKSFKASELKPVFRMTLGNESKILHLAEQSALANHQHPHREKIPSIPYSEWLNKSEDPPDEKPRVSFDHAPSSDELLSASVHHPERDVPEPRIEVIETEKAPNTPKSILKNVRKNSKQPVESEQDKLLAWKMEYHQREAMVGSRLRALVARADEFFINHQNNNLTYPISPFQLPDIEPLKFPHSADELSNSSASSSVESFAELKFNSSSSSDEFGKLKNPNPTPEPTKTNPITGDRSESNEDNHAMDSFSLIPDGRNLKTIDLSVRRHSHPIDNMGHSFKPITGQIECKSDQTANKDTPHRTMSMNVSGSMTLKSGMSIDKATELVRHFFQSESDRSRISSPVVGSHQTKQWNLPEGSLTNGTRHPSNCSSTTSSISDLSPAPSVPSSCTSQGSQSDRGRAQMRSRIPVRINRLTNSSALGYSRSLSLCASNTNEPSSAKAAHLRANSVGSRRFWSSSSSVALATNSKTTTTCGH